MKISKLLVVATLFAVVFGTAVASGAKNELIQRDSELLAKDEQVKTTSNVKEGKWHCKAAKFRKDHIIVKNKEDKVVKLLKVPAGEDVGDFLAKMQGRADLE